MAQRLVRLGLRRSVLAVLGDLLIEHLRGRRLVRVLVLADERERSEVVRVHVRVSEVARAREELLDGALVRDPVRRSLLEDDEVEREAVLHTGV